MLVKSSLCLWIFFFCLLILSVTEKGLLKSPKIIGSLFILAILSIFDLF